MHHKGTRMSRHINADTPDRQDSSAEKPEFQFRGVWVPAGVFHALAAGDITPKEMSLLGLVEALYRYGHGCHASNRYIAKVLDIHPMSVVRMVTRLKRRGFLICHQCAAGRVMETSWSRAGEYTEGQVSAQRLGGVSAQRLAKSKTKNTTYSSSSSQQEEETPCAPAPPARRDGTVHFKVKAIRPRTKPVQPPAPPGPGEEKPMPAPFSACEAPAMTRPASGPDMVLAERYKALAASKGWPAPRNMRQWESCFAELRSRLAKEGREKELIPCLDWFEKRTGKDEVPVLPTPFKFSMYFNWLTELMKKNPAPRAPVTITEQARKIADAFADDFPEGFETDLKTYVQESLDHATALFKNLRAAAKDGNHLAHRMVNDLLSPSEFVKDWLTNRADFARWASKKGRKVGPGQVVFRPGLSYADTYLEEIGCRASKEYSGDANRWHQLKAVLKPIKP